MISGGAVNISQEQLQSDGDLLLGMLNRMAEMGVQPKLSRFDLCSSPVWLCCIDHPEDGPCEWGAPTPLEAVIAAFVQLPAPLPASQGDA